MSQAWGCWLCFVQLIDENKWYNFDDSHVSPVSESEVKTTAAYVLFYKRIRSEESLSTDEQENGVKGHLSNHKDLPLSSEIGGSKLLIPP